MSLAPDPGRTLGQGSFPARKFHVPHSDLLKGKGPRITLAKLARSGVRRAETTSNDKERRPQISDRRVEDGGAKREMVQGPIRAGRRLAAFPEPIDFKHFSPCFRDDRQMGVEILPNSAGRRQALGHAAADFSFSPKALTTFRPDRAPHPAASRRGLARSSKVPESRMKCSGMAAE